MQERIVSRVLYIIFSPTHIKVIIHPKGVFIIKCGCGEHSLLIVMNIGAGA